MLLALPISNFPVEELLNHALRCYLIPTRNLGVLHEMVFGFCAKHRWFLYALQSLFGILDE